MGIEEAILELMKLRNAIKANADTRLLQALEVCINFMNTIINNKDD